MSFKSLFSKEGRQERALQKACAKALNKKIKPDDRRPALYNLIEDGGEDAVMALLGRLTFIYDTNMVMDEEEKKMVYRGLIGMGDPIVPVVRKHLKRSPTLSWGFRIISELCDPEEVWDILAEVLEDYEPEYERDPNRKIQLMTFLGDFKDPRAVEALLPFLEDHDETVRFVTVESLFKQEDESCREQMLQLLTNEDEESLRIKHRILDGFIDVGWRVKGFKGTVEKLVAAYFPEFVVDGKGRLKRKKARK